MPSLVKPSNWEGFPEFSAPNSLWCKQDIQFQLPPQRISHPVKFPLLKVKTHGFCVFKYRLIWMYLGTMQNQLYFLSKNINTHPKHTTTQHKQTYANTHTHNIHWIRPKCSLFLIPPSEFGASLQNHIPEVIRAGFGFTLKLDNHQWNDLSFCLKGSFGLSPASYFDISHTKPIPSGIAYMNISKINGEKVPTLTPQRHVEGTRQHKTTFQDCGGSGKWYDVYVYIMIYMFIIILEHEHNIWTIPKSKHDSIIEIWAHDCIPGWL